MQATVHSEGRPTSVILFEALSIVPTLAAMLLWDNGSPFAELAELLVVVALTLWVTRGRSKTGRLVCTGLLMFTAVAAIAAVLSGYVPPTTSIFPFLMFAMFAAQLGGLVTLLWWPTTSLWLSARGRA